MGEPMIVLRWVTTVFVILTFAACGFGGDDDKDDSDNSEAPLPQGFSQTPLSQTGTLALAFPGSMNLASSLVAEDTTALHLQGTGPITEKSKPQSPAQKEAQVNGILEAQTVNDCFQLTIVSLTQPGCFAPNIQSADITAAASGANPYVVAMPDGVTQQLYGDGGIAQKSEGDESCTAATINYFTEEALSYIEQGRQAFASLVCLSKFNERATLPAPGTTTDYMATLGALHPPDGVNFKQAQITAEAGADGTTVYTTQLTIGITDGVQPESNLYAYFRHAPELADGTQKGHVVVMRNGQNDALQSANQLMLQDPPPPPPGGESGAPPPPGSGGGSAGNKTNVASVAYEIASGMTKAYLTRGTFKGDNATAATHPATYFDANGLLSYTAIGDVATDNSFADNFVDTRFVQNPSTGVLGEGIVGWTASLSDSFWRSFAYRVAENADSSQTAQATFGFAQGYVAGQPQHLPTAANGMFCYWAQMGNTQGAAGTTHLESTGLSGPAADKVQYQVSTRAGATGTFVHSDAESKLSYTIATDCGTNDLADVTSDGSITDVFTAPATPTFTPLGGVVLDFNAIDLSHAP